MRGPSLLILKSVLVLFMLSTAKKDQKEGLHVKQVLLELLQSVFSYIVVCARVCMICLCISKLY